MNSRSRLPRVQELSELNQYRHQELHSLQALQEIHVHRMDAMLSHIPIQFHGILLRLQQIPNLVFQQVSSLIL